MAHHHERARVHTSSPHSVRDRLASTAPAARIDCDTCPVAGRGCAGCMVALLGPVRLALDATEQGAVATLLARGLVTREEADSAYAEPDLPEWMLAARHDADQESPLRRIG